MRSQLFVDLYSMYEVHLEFSCSRSPLEYLFREARYYEETSNISSAIYSYDQFRIDENKSVPRKQSGSHGSNCVGVCDWLDQRRDPDGCPLEVISCH